jgi:hypothetical protein
MQFKGQARETQISEYLRAFAEHITQRTHDLLATNPDLPVDEMVDLIPPMESRDPYERD